MKHQKAVKINIPDVNPDDWVQIGRKKDVNAVISNIFEQVSANEGNIEVVYLDRLNRAVNEDLIWTGSNWQFIKKGVGGHYADKCPRLAFFISILRIAGIAASASCSEHICRPISAFIEGFPDLETHLVLGRALDHSLTQALDIEGISQKKPSLR